MAEPVTEPIGNVGAASTRVAVARAAQRLAAEGLLIGTAGNVSARIPDTDLVAVTATGVVLAACTPEDVCVVDARGRVVEGDLAPTSELGLHLAVYDGSPAAAVVHTHAPFATAVACVLDVLPVLHYQQLLLGGEIRVAPYATFGTGELAEAAVAALVDRQAALLANHGSVSLGSTLDKAVENALLLEWLCTLHHRASALGTPRVLDEQQQADVVLQALALDYGTRRSKES